MILSHSEMSALGTHGAADVPVCAAKPSQPKAVLPGKKKLDKKQKLVEAADQDFVAMDSGTAQAVSEPAGDPASLGMGPPAGIQQPITGQAPHGYPCTSSAAGATASPGVGAPAVFQWQQLPNIAVDNQVEDLNLVGNGFGAQGGANAAGDLAPPSSCTAAPGVSGAVQAGLWRAAWAGRVIFEAHGR